MDKTNKYSEKRRREKLPTLESVASQRNYLKDSMRSLRVETAYQRRHLDPFKKTVSDWETINKKKLSDLGVWL